LFVIGYHRVDQEQRPTAWSANCCKAASEPEITDGSKVLPLYNSWLEKHPVLNKQFIEPSTEKT